MANFQLARSLIKNRPNLRNGFSHDQKRNRQNNKEIKVRLTEAEHQALLERMTGGELATWVRNTCLEEKPNKKRNYKVADPQLLAALGQVVET